MWPSPLVLLRQWSISGFLPTGERRRATWRWPDASAASVKRDMTGDLSGSLLRIALWDLSGSLLRNVLLFCGLFCPHSLDANDEKGPSFALHNFRNWISLRLLCMRSLRFVLEVLPLLCMLCVLFMSLASLAICESRFARYLVVSLRSLLFLGQIKMKMGA